MASSAPNGSSISSTSASCASARERGALAHATRELVRSALGEVAEVHHLEQLLGPGAPLAARHARELQGDLDVAPHGEPREERGFLEHQARALGPHVDAPRRGLVEAGDEIEQRALAASRRAEQAHELALLDVERHTFERDDALAPGAERLGHVGDGDNGARHHLGPGERRIRGETRGLLFFSRRSHGVIVGSLRLVRSLLRMSRL